MIPDSFLHRRGVRYYSQFKPEAPCEFLDQVFVIPAGWEMIPYGDGGLLRGCRSYFVGPSEWTDERLWERFREWVVFDSFVMQTNGAGYFDDNRFRIEEIAYSVYEGSPGDGNDNYNAVSYADVTRFLAAEFTKPDTLPSLQYAELYVKYSALHASEKALLEWFVSAPPRPKRIDAFFGWDYWGLLHLTVLLEKIVGLPPTCTLDRSPCLACGRMPPPHQVMSRSVWLRRQLNNYIGDPALVEEYASLIEAAKLIRDGMSHGPYFDRSVMPEMVEGEILRYGPSQATSAFRDDSHALAALLIAVQRLAHALLVDRAFSIKHYQPSKTLKTTLISQSGYIT